MENIIKYVYLDYDSDPYVWNIARGAFCSSGLIQEKERSFFVSFWFLNLLQNTEKPHDKRAFQKLKSEYELELFRSKFYPEAVSRLRGLFAFSTLDDAVNVLNNGAWGCGQMHQDYLSEVGVTVKHRTKVDSNWINLIMDEENNLCPNWENYAHKYWKGEPCLSMTPIWEEIIEGWFCIWQEDVRVKAVERVKEIWPHSQTMLCFSAKAG